MATKIYESLLDLSQILSLILKEDRIAAILIEYIATTNVDIKYKSSHSLNIEQISDDTLKFIFFISKKIASSSMTEPEITAILTTEQKGTDNNSPITKIIIVPKQLNLLVEAIIHNNNTDIVQSTFKSIDALKSSLRVGELGSNKYIV